MNLGKVVPPKRTASDSNYWKTLMYREGAAGLERLGFNGLDTFDTELPRTGEREFNLTDKEKIAELMKDPNLRPGKMHKLGLVTVNGGLLLEARRRKLLEDEKEKKRKAEEAEEKEEGGKNDALYYYHRWKTGGKPLDSKGKIKLSLKGARAIVKVLMPRVDPTKKVAEYTALYKIVEWLEGLEDWEAEMDQIDKDVSERTMAKHKPLW